MMPLYQYLEIYQPKKPDLEKVYQEEIKNTLSKKMKTAEDEAEKKGKPMSSFGANLIKSGFEKAIKHEIVEGYKKKLCSNWQSIISRYNRYEKPSVINKNLVTDPYNTYVMPIFLKPGKQNFFIFTE